MRKIIFTCLVLLLATGHSWGIIDVYGRKHYNFAVDLTNPLSLMSKGGIALENRVGRLSYLVSYTKYWGVYAGTQLGFELDYFLRTRKRHEWFIYAKALTGDASYDSKKLSVLGDHSNVYIDPHLYAGGGLGIGRRYNFKSFFIAWRTGVQMLPIVDEISTEDKNLYRLFYVTGPGSILEFNVRFGLQF